MKNLFLTAAFTLAGTVLFAQATPEAAKAEAPATTQDVKQACNMPDMEAVQTLELSDDQLVAVREIHAECERTCKESIKATGSVDTETMAQYEARVQEVLEPAQYERYKELKNTQRSEEIKSVD
jgi:hypothetical protein